jgi:hypothetical protein
MIVADSLLLAITAGGFRLSPYGVSLLALNGPKQKGRNIKALTMVGHCGKYITCPRANQGSLMPECYLFA